MTDKSVYSIVLADDVVEGIDRLAYEMNCSRSNLINQILAEHLQMMTPEKRIQEIFSGISRLMDDRFQLLAGTGSSVLAVKSPLRYKYKPTLRYSLEIFREFGNRIGRLKVTMRTQSQALLNELNRFFLIWNHIEEKYLSEVFPEGIPSEFSEGKFTRDFYSPEPEKLSDENISKAMGGYINLNYKCIQIYFDGMGDDITPYKIEEEYKKYLSGGITIF